jgi:hypothetical protein
VRARVELGGDDVAGSLRTARPFTPRQHLIALLGCDFATLELCSVRAARVLLVLSLGLERVLAPFPERIVAGAGMASDPDVLVLLALEGAEEMGGLGVERSTVTCCRLSRI